MSGTVLPHIGTLGQQKQNDTTTELMPPRETIWALDPHTVGKHLVLSAYLNAWIPIIGQRGERVVIIDGFAGPGVYANGEPGSPMIALDLVRSHTALSRIGEVVMLFVEQDPKRFAALKNQIALRGDSLPKEISIHAEHGTFAEAMTALRQAMDENSSQLAPSFTMIDPFGVKGVTHDDIRWLLAQPKSELYVSFMVPWAARFIASSEFEQHLDAFLGPIDWRSTIGAPFLKAVENLQNMFDASLRAAGATHVVRFDLFNANTYKYSIFFASKHELGCAKMKEAIWKAMPNGSYSYRDSAGAQLAFDMHAIGLDTLDDELEEQLSSEDWTKVEDLNTYLCSDQTRFYPTQLKKSLARLEKAERITVKDGSRTRRGSYPNGTLLRRATPPR